MAFAEVAFSIYLDLLGHNKVLWLVRRADRKYSPGNGPYVIRVAVLLKLAGKGPAFLRRGPGMRRRICSLAPMSILHLQSFVVGSFIR